MTEHSVVLVASPFMTERSTYPIAETAASPTEVSGADSWGSFLPGIPGYEILDRLGQGGMGIVYRARQIKLNRIVALKLLLAGAHASAELRARFRTEAESLARLHHPNIVQIHDVGDADGCLYLSLEFVGGISLDQHFGGKPQSPAAAARLILSLARALQFIHEHGILHRDLKPANILVAPDGTPKITDFGIAKLQETGSGKLVSPTRTGDVMGTPSYMAPEQASGVIKAIGPAADVYALGAILYEALTGRPPHLAESPAETLIQVLLIEPVPPRVLQTKLPRDLNTICMKCLEKIPTKRYRSAADLADDVERFVAGTPIRARPAGFLERTTKWAKRRPSTAALIAVCIVALFGVISGGIWHNLRLRSERDRSQVNFDVALIAIDQLTSLVETGAELQVDPQALLEAAQAFYQDLQNNLGQDPAHRKDLAKAMLRLGDILRKLDRHEQSETAYRQAIEHLTLLASENPSNPRFQQQLAYCHNFLGEVHRRASRSDDAVAAYQRALGIQARLIAQFPKEPVYAREMARTRYNLGIVLKDLNENENAARTIQQAIETLLSLGHESRDDPVTKKELAHGYLNLGTALRPLAQYDAADHAYSQSITLYEELAHDHPRVPEFSDELAIALTNRANLLSGISTRGLDTRATFERVVELRRKLAKDYPRRPSFRRELANTLNSLASFHAKSGDTAAASHAWSSAIDLWQGLVTEDSRTPDYQFGLGMSLHNLGWLTKESGDLVDAPDVRAWPGTFACCARRESKSKRIPECGSQRVLEFGRDMCEAS